MYKKVMYAIFLSYLFLFLNACSLPVYNTLDNVGQSYQVVSSDNFKHLWVANAYVDSDVSFVVFIEGDGQPWLRPDRIAFEPTPEEPLLLSWFLSVDFPAVYLGRPCYFALQDDQCSAYWYTHGRYSERVVSSLVQVLKKHVTNRNIILVGHSGGGTLAMLMAEKLPNVEAVVTIAANLQVNKWAEYHNYSKLQGSLDPNLRKPLPAYIQQLHLYSPFDEVIRSEWIKAFSEKQANSVLVELPVDGHNLAWLPFYSEFRKALFSIDANKTGIDVD